MIGFNFQLELVWVAVEGEIILLTALHFSRVPHGVVIERDKTLLFLGFAEVLVGCHW